jgi:hypothetical protein
MKKLGAALIQQTSIQTSVDFHQTKTRSSWEYSLRIGGAIATAS